MAKKRMNTNEVASRFISGLSKNEEQEVEVKTSKKEDSKSEKVERSRPFIQSSGYQQRAYYISDEHYKMLKLLAVERDTDTSSLVREALENFLE